MSSRSDYHSISSASSSDFGNSRSGKSSRSKRKELNHPRLIQLRKAARKDAEKAHAELTEQRKHEKNPAPTKVKTRRQASNKKSAEICREAKTIYTQKLERELVHEEDKYQNLLRGYLVQSEKTHVLKQKIRNIEARRDEEERKKSWLYSNMEEENQNQFFRLVPEGHGSLLDDFHTESVPSPWNDDHPAVDSEYTNSIYNSVMDLETEVPNPPRKRARVSNEEAVLKAEGSKTPTCRGSRVQKAMKPKAYSVSPVSVFQTDPLIPETELLTSCIFDMVRETS